MEVRCLNSGGVSLLRADILHFAQVFVGSGIFHVSLTFFEEWYVNSENIC